MTRTADPYFALQADRGQPDNVTEAYYDFVDSFADDAVSMDYINQAWEARCTRRRAEQGWDTFFDTQAYAQGYRDDAPWLGEVA